MAAFTGAVVYAMALAQLSQQPGDNPTWDTLAVAWLNLALAEMLPAINALARYEGRETGDTPPAVTSLDDELPVSPAFTAALAQALAAALWQDAGETERSRECRALAANYTAQAIKVRPEPITSCY